MNTVASLIVYTNDGRPFFTPFSVRITKCARALKCNSSKT